MSEQLAHDTLASDMYCIIPPHCLVDVIKSNADSQHEAQPVWDKYGVMSTDEKLLLLSLCPWTLEDVHLVIYWGAGNVSISGVPIWREVLCFLAACGLFLNSFLKESLLHFFFFSTTSSVFFRALAGKWVEQEKILMLNYSNPKQLLCKFYS